MQLMKKEVLHLTICGLGFLLAANVSCVATAKNDLMRVEKVGATQGSAEIYKISTLARSEEASTFLNKDPLLAAPVIVGHEAAALRTEIQGLANELSRNLADADPENGDLSKGILVCTFVELKKLSRTSSLGRYVAEQLMNEMQQRHYEVVELRKSQAVMLQEKRGEFGLSRNPAEVSQAVTAGAMLTGTYTPSKDSIVINARIIDNRSAKLLSSATAIIPRNRLAELLLADTASVREGRPEPLYLKKLEL